MLRLLLRARAHLTNESVSMSWKCLDELGIFSCVIQRLPETLHRIIQPLVEVNEGVGRPDLSLNFLTRDDFSGMLKENTKHLEWLVLQFYPDAVFTNLTRPQFNFKRSESDNPARWMCVSHRNATQLQLPEFITGPSNRLDTIQFSF